MRRQSATDGHTSKINVINRSMDANDLGNAQAGETGHAARHKNAEASDASGSAATGSSDDHSGSALHNLQLAALMQWSPESRKRTADALIEANRDQHGLTKSHSRASQLGTSGNSLVPHVSMSTSNTQKQGCKQDSPSYEKAKTGRVTAVADNARDWVCSRRDGRDNQGIQGLEEFARCLNSIPDDKKGAYLQAAVACRRLLNVESDPMKFLTFEKGDAAAAAVRFVAYWEWRLVLFGNKHFVLPLNMTGCGAIPPEDLTLCECGHIRILPCDNRGRSVLYFNIGAAIRDGPARARVGFYFFSMMMRNPLTATEGFPVLCVVNATTLERTIGRVAMGNMVKQAFPFTMHIHFVKVLGEEYEKDFVQKFLPTVTQVYRSKYTVHSGTDPDHLIESLTSHGFLVESLPKEFNGSLEDTSIDCYRDVASSVAASQSTKEKDYVKERSRSAKASKIKRERARERELAMHSQRNELLQEQIRLLHENERLTNLVLQARKVLTNMPIPAPAAPIAVPAPLLFPGASTLPLPIIGARTSVGHNQSLVATLLAAQSLQRQQLQQLQQQAFSQQQGGQANQQQSEWLRMNFWQGQR